MNREERMESKRADEQKQANDQPTSGAADRMQNFSRGYVTDGGNALSGQAYGGQTGGYGGGSSSHGSSGWYGGTGGYPGQGYGSGGYGSQGTGGQGYGGYGSQGYGAGYGGYGGQQFSQGQGTFSPQGGYGSQGYGAGGYGTGHDSAGHWGEQAGRGSRPGSSGEWGYQQGQPRHPQQSSPWGGQPGMHTGGEQGPSGQHSGHYGAGQSYGGSPGYAPGQGYQQGYGPQSGQPYRPQGQGQAQHGYGSQGYGSHGAGQQYGSSSPGGYGAASYGSQAFGGWGGAEERGRGRAPKGYQRSDQRLQEEICERIVHQPEIDASDVEIEVKEGVASLTGVVDSRHTKHRIEDVVDSVWGIKDIHNNIRVKAGGFLGGLLGGDRSERAASHEHRQGDSDQAIRGHDSSSGASRIPKSETDVSGSNGGERSSGSRGE